MDCDARHLFYRLATPNVLKTHDMKRPRSTRVWFQLGEKGTSSAIDVTGPTPLGLFTSTCVLFFRAGVSESEKMSLASRRAFICEKGPLLIEEPFASSSATAHIKQSKFVLIKLVLGCGTYVADAGPTA